MTPCAVHCSRMRPLLAPSMQVLLKLRVQECRGCNVERMRKRPRRHMHAAAGWHRCTHNERSTKVKVVS